MYSGETITRYVGEQIEDESPMELYRREHGESAKLVGSVFAKLAAVANGFLGAANENQITVPEFTALLDYASFVMQHIRR